MKNSKLKLVNFFCLTALLLGSCGKRNQFSNDFPGGHFSMTVYDCEHGPFEDDKVIEQNAKGIIIRNSGGLCLNEALKYNITGKARIVENKVLIHLDEKDEIRSQYSDEDIEENTCTCANEMRFVFDHPVPKELEVEFEYGMDSPQ